MEGKRPVRGVGKEALSHALAPRAAEETDHSEHCHPQVPVGLEHVRGPGQGSAEVKVSRLGRRAGGACGIDKRGAGVKPSAEMLCFPPLPRGLA